MASTSTPQAISDKRLYVGNLSTTVDEYSLMQLCAKYGKISKLDYLFHKAGPQRGKPRGYAFVEYGTKEEAQRALSVLHEKVFRGRKLVVSLASEQDPKETNTLGGKKKRTGGGGRNGANDSEINRPTAISLLKGGQGMNTGQPVPTNRKIAALEAKLAAMQQKKDSPSPSTNDSGGAGEWLDTFLPSSSSSTTSTTTRIGGEGKGEGGDKGKSEKVKMLDVSKAGLPTRPYFESKGPTREL